MDEFRNPSLKIIVQLYKISTNLTAIIMPSSLRRSLGFLTIRTRSANMEQSRTSKLHTTLSMPINSSLIYTRYILKRKLQSHILLSTKSRSIHIDEKFEINCHLTRREIYISMYFFYISFK